MRVALGEPVAGALTTAACTVPAMASRVWSDGTSECASIEPIAACGSARPDEQHLVPP